MRPVGRVVELGTLPIHRMRLSHPPSAAIAGILCLVLALAWLMFRNPGPTYEGKSVKHWCKVLWAGSPAEQTNAAMAIRIVGTNAIPILQDMLRVRDSKARSALLELCSKQSIVRYPYLDRDIDLQRIAMKAVDALGEQAELMVPTLNEVIREWPSWSLDIVYEASRIAAQFEPATTPHLVVKDGKPQLVLPNGLKVKE